MPNKEEHKGWLAQLLRLSVFPRSTLLGTDDLWHRLTEREPEIDEHRRKEGVRRQVGPHREGKMEVSVGLGGRVNVLLTPDALPDLYLGPFEPEAEAFKELVRLLAHLRSRYHLCPHRAG